MALLFVLAGVVLLLLFVAYAIYRAGNDPVFPRPMLREFKQVRFDHVAAWVREGWRLSDQDDESDDGWVLLERTRPADAPPEPDRAPPNAHRWTDVH